MLVITCTAIWDAYKLSGWSILSYGWEKHSTSLYHSGQWEKYCQYRKDPKSSALLKTSLLCRSSNVNRKKVWSKTYTLISVHTNNIFCFFQRQTSIFEVAADSFLVNGFCVQSTVHVVIHTFRGVFEYPVTRERAKRYNETVYNII